MILVDTSVWINHLRDRNETLAAMLLDAHVLCHPFILGELACGTLKHRSEILSLLTNLRQAPLVGHDEVLTLVETRSLMGSGIGWIDAHLLASSLLAGTRLWTLDRPLVRASRKLGVLWTS